MLRLLLAASLVVLVPFPTVSQQAGYAQIREQAKTAFKAEMSREGDKDCGNEAGSDQALCLDQASELTDAHYKTYTDALRKLIAPDQHANGGKQTNLRDFDAAQSAWEAYRKAQCISAYDIDAGSTFAPAAEGTCYLQITRSHMRELNAIYASTLGG